MRATGVGVRATALQADLSVARRNHLVECGSGCVCAPRVGALALGEYHGGGPPSPGAGLNFVSSGLGAQPAGVGGDVVDCALFQQLAQSVPRCGPEW